MANKVYSHIDAAEFQKKLEQTFGHAVLGVLPLSEDLARLESRKLIVKELPDSMISHTIRHIAQRVLS